MRTYDSWTHLVLDQLSDDFEPWMSCDECFDRSDGILEGILSGEASMPAAFRAHLAGCAACRGELEILGDLASIDRGMDPALTRARLDAEIARRAQ